MTERIIKWGTILNSIIIPLVKANKPLRKERRTQDINKLEIHLDIYHAFNHLVKSLKISSHYFRKLERKASRRFPAKITDFPVNKQAIIEETLKKLKYLMIERGLDFDVHFTVDNSTQMEILQELENWPETREFRHLEIDSTILYSLDQMQELVKATMGGGTLELLCDPQTAHRIITRAFDNGLEKGVLDPTIVIDEPGIIDMGSEVELAVSETSAGSEDEGTRLLEFSLLEDEEKTEITGLELQSFTPDTDRLLAQVAGNIDISTQYLKDTISEYGCIAEATKTVTFDYLLGPASLAFLPICLTLTSGDYATMSLELYKLLKIVGALTEKGVGPDVITAVLEVFLEDTVGTKDILLDPSTVDVLDEEERLLDLNPTREANLNGPMTASREKDLNYYVLESGTAWKSFKSILSGMGRNCIKFDYRAMNQLSKEKGGLDEFDSSVHESE